MTVRIMVGHVLAELAKLPDESVHCVVSSPPYYGLRDYGIPPQVWGGEPGCEHEWVTECVAPQSGGTGAASAKQVTNAGTQGGVQRTIERAFCLRCGAWRCSLGLEPTVALYLDHMVEICREIRRVLRSDGTFWLNLGSSYASQGGHTAQGKNSARKGRSNVAAQNAVKGYDASGDKNPILSRQPSRALACDIDDKEPRCSPNPGSAYSDPGDEYQGGSQSHRDHSADTHLSQRRSSLPTEPTSRDNEHSDCAADLSSIAQLAARLSTNPALPQSAQVAFARAATVWADLIDAPTSLAAALESVRRMVNISGTVPQSGPSVDRTLDKAFSNSACYCGSCGKCFVRLAMSALKFKPKDLMDVPNLVKLALQADGWWCRSTIAWCKKSPMPESVTDRPTSAHEHVFLLTRSPKYFYDADAVKEDSITGDPRRPYTSQGAWDLDGRPTEQRHGGKLRPSVAKGGGFSGKWSETDQPAFRAIIENRNLRNFWLLGPSPFPEAHFATFHPRIPEIAILAGTSERGVCPKCGAQWARMTETKADDRVPYATVGAGEKAKSCRGDGNGFNKVLREDGRGGDLATKRRETLGWRATCGCDAGEPLPATVLDPFLGSGTTALVADRLGRNCIGIELSEGYAAMARRRCEDDAGLFAEVAAE